MNTKTMKILVAVATLLTMVAMCTSVVFAEPAWPEANYQGTEKITDFGGKIMGILTTLGMVVAVIVLMILGIKYMMGSAEEKAEYKKTMIPYLIGAALLFGASGIAQMVYSFANGLAK